MRLIYMPGPHMSSSKQLTQQPTQVGPVAHQSLPDKDQASGALPQKLPDEGSWLGRFDTLFLPDCLHASGVPRGDLLPDEDQASTRIFRGPDGLPISSAATRGRRNNDSRA